MTTIGVSYRALFEFGPLRLLFESGPLCLLFESGRRSTAPFNVRALRPISSNASQQGAPDALRCGSPPGIHLYASAGQPLRIANSSATSKAAWRKRTVGTTMRIRACPWTATPQAARTAAVARSQGVRPSNGGQAVAPAGKPSHRGIPSSCRSALLLRNSTAAQLGPETDSRRSASRARPLPAFDEPAVEREREAPP